MEEIEDVVDDHEHDVLSNNDDNHMDIDEVDVQAQLLPSGFYVFDCPHPQCIKQFRRFSNLETHLNIGKHVFTKTVKPLLDQAKLFYKQLIDSDTSRLPITLNQFNSMPSTSQSKITNTLPQGWALAKKKAPIHYSAEVISFLHDAFQEGITTGFKWDPVVLSQEMVFTEINGQPRFHDNDCLSAEQIKAFFSKLKAKRSKESSQSKSNSISSQSQSNFIPSQSSINNTNNNSKKRNTKTIEQIITMEDDTSDEQQSYDEDMSVFNASVEANQIEKLRVIAMEAFPYDEDDDN